MNEHYKTITLDLSRDALFSEEGKSLLDKYYSDGKSGVQKAIAKAAYCFCNGDTDLAQRIYDYASKHWFFYSSPILSNAIEGDWVMVNNSPVFIPAEKQTGLPIACFGSYLPDTIPGQIDAYAEIAALSVAGGGTALHNGIRAISGKAPGPIAYLKTIDASMGYYRQGKTRRGSCCIYMDVSHPDIEEFISIRKLSGGDTARKFENKKSMHHAVNISEAFADAVENDTDWGLICPHSHELRGMVRARELWEKILALREETGEPFLYFIDVANAALPEVQRKLGLTNNGSNLCTEITLATSPDRTFVCCLSSLNAEYYDEWKDTTIVEDLVTFLDNVIEWFILTAPPSLRRAVNSAKAERAIGIGVMGWHNLLFKRGIPFESGGFNSAVQLNHELFRTINERGIGQSRLLARTRGEPSDLVGTGRRNSHIFAVAPNANSSILCNTSPSIEPIASNAYPQKGRAGIYLVKNKYLVPVLQKYGMDTEEVWQDIINHNGSVQHLPLPDDVRLLFKTAWEMDQHWLVQHAEDRQQYICQAQSLNLFFMPGTDRAYINSVHLKAMRGKKVKSLYYFRTGAETSADTIKEIVRKPLNDWKESACVSCEG